MTRLYLVRHGETYWEPETRLKGQLDVPLNRRGREQAAAAAACLGGAGASAVYCSTLVRARETARPIAAALGCPLLPSPLLNERRWGLWQALTVEEVRRERAAGRTGRGRSAPLGESWPEFAARAQLFLDFIAGGRAGETAVAVTHGGTLKDMVLPVLGVPPANRQAFTAETGSISLLDHDGRAWRAVFLNADPAWVAEHEGARAATPAGATSHRS